MQQYLSTVQTVGCTTPHRGWYSFAKRNVGFIEVHLFPISQPIFSQNSLDHDCLGPISFVENYSVIGKEEMGNY